MELSLNLSKCRVFTFSWMKSLLLFSYCLGENNIPRVSNYGFKLSYNLSTYLAKHVCCKAFKNTKLCYEIVQKLSAWYVC